MFKRFAIFLLIGFSLINCASTNTASAQTGDAESQIRSNQPRYILIPESPVLGEPVTVATITAFKNVELIVNDKQISRAASFLVPAENGQPSFTAAIIAVPSSAAPGDAIIRINNDLGVFAEVPITIAPREFRSQTLNFDAAVSSIVNDPNPQRTREAEIIWSIWSSTGNQIYHSGTFSLPVTSTRRTSPYGFRRTNIYSDGTRSGSTHTGVDFGIPTGTEVRACARGLVRLARMRVLTGNSVIIEHAPGIYTMYYHLDSVIAQESRIVNTGDIIGLSGSTGMSTGPHLHWEMRVSGEFADPDIYVDRPLLDKSRIISTLFR